MYCQQLKMIFVNYEIYISGECLKSKLNIVENLN
jgi:hypothetical protein